MLTDNKPFWIRCKLHHRIYNTYDYVIIIIQFIEHKDVFYIKKTNIENFTYGTV